MTTIKIQIGNALKDDYIYVVGKGSITEIYYSVSAFVSMFRTQCIAFKGSSINKYHFVNWLNKHTDLRAYHNLPVNGRIDL